MNPHRLDAPDCSEIRQVLVDEGVNEKGLLFERFRKAVPLPGTVQFVHLAKSHRAIPDCLILSQMLGPHTILLTTDRVLHNQASDLGFRSYTLDEHQNLVGKKPGKVVVSKPLLPVPKGPIKSDYAHEFSPIASVLKASLSERDLKRYRTRRRRIRGYFGMEANIGSAAVTVGAKHTRRGWILGFFLALAAKDGAKQGLRASEGYAQLRPDGQSSPALCLIHALRDLYLLQLEQVQVELFVIPPDSLSLCQNLLLDSAAALRTPDVAVLHKMLNGLASLQVRPCVKGRFFEAMQNKLNQVSQPQCNELVQVDFSIIIQSLFVAHPIS